MAELLSQLPERCFDVCLARLKAAPWCDPDGPTEVARLDLLEQNLAVGVDQENPRGVAVDDRRRQV
jgi:hypothetical protein